MKKIIKIFLLIYSTIIITITTCGSIFAFNSIKNLSNPEISRVLDKKYSEIYDDSSRLIETLGQNKRNYVQYDDIPPYLINALISIEDNQFFNHEGLNYRRIISSLFNNIFNSSTQGGSTITQQLIKNMLLSNEQSLKRKIQEAYLATLLEQKMSKEEILEYYFNEIYFEGTIPGISYACQRFFNKEVSQINLVESALLVGLVKSPSYYNPFLHPDRAKQRKDIVLKAMLDNHYISLSQYQHGITIEVSSLIIDKGSSYVEKNYAFQAYLDIVYQEVEQLTGYNPFSVPMKIETYLDTSLQSFLDDIQKGNVFKFNDELQQIGSAVIRNSDSSIIGVIGGRNYNGMMLYNHAYNHLRQPASTMKPIFTYALAMEYLDFNEYTPVEDKPYTYPNSNITVQNADKNYLGTIPLVDAIGFSRNTSTLYTLEKIINKIGEEKVVQYLRDIEIMDEGEFAYPYAIGGMKYGATPIAMAGAYSMLAREGNFLHPSTIKSITLIDTNEKLYSRDLTGKQVISKESSYIMSSTLTKVMDHNYYNINYARPLNMVVCGKTGTNAYDKNTINKLKYPSYADKDVWFCGYSKNYTIACWSGFDESLKDYKTYFGHNDSRRLICKDIFRASLEKLELKNKKFDMPSSLTKISIVKGIPGNYLPNELVPSSYIVEATFKKENVPYEVLPLPQLKKIEQVNIIATEDSLEIDISHELIDDELYKYLFGKKVYLITYEDEDQIETNTYQTNHITIENYRKSFKISICEAFENNQKLTGDIYEFNFNNDISIL